MPGGTSQLSSLSKQTQRASRNNHNQYKAIFLNGNYNNGAMESRILRSYVSFVSLEMFKIVLVPQLLKSNFFPLPVHSGKIVLAFARPSNSGTWENDDACERKKTSEKKLRDLTCFWYEKSLERFDVFYRVKQKWTFWQFHWCQYVNANNWWDALQDKDEKNIDSLLIDYGDAERIMTRWRMYLDQASREIEGHACPSFFKFLGQIQKNKTEE